MSLSVDISAVHLGVQRLVSYLSELFSCSSILFVLRPKGMGVAEARTDNRAANTITCVLVFLGRNSPLNCGLIRESVSHL